MASTAPQCRDNGAPRPSPLASDTPLRAQCARPTAVTLLTDRFAPCARPLAYGLCWLALLAGCATPPQAPTPAPGLPAPSAPPPPASPRAAPPTPAVSPLVSEQRWLENLFRDTPVVITLVDVNTLAVDVPLANSFDSGKSTVKPALAKVLEYISTSLRRQPAMRVSISAPTDAAAGNVALAAARGQQVREALLARGITATRLAGVGTARAGAPVQLRLLIAPQGIGWLDDATLPLPAAGARAVSAATASSGRR